MTPPHHDRRASLVWLIATLMLASCASRPPVREPDDTVRQLRAEYLQANPAGQFNRNIERGEVALGMQFADVIAAWGIPDTREREQKGARERWSYTVTDPWSRDWVRYDLVFEEKALASWETMRNVSSSHSLTGRDAAAPQLPPMPAGVARR